MHEGYSHGGRLMSEQEATVPNHGVVPGTADRPATEGTVEPLRAAARDARAPRRLAALRTQVFTILALVALVLFAALTILVSDGLTTDVDLSVTRTVQSVTFSWVEGLMVGVSWPGFPPQAPLLVAAVAALFWLTGYRIEAAFSVAAAASNVLTEIIKHVVARSRPSDDLVHVIATAAGQSFPSGHVLFYVTFFGFLAYVAYATFKRGPTRMLLLGVFTLVIVLIGPSRVWMGQHWASDALASYTLGFAYLVMLVEMYSRYRFHRTAMPSSPTIDPV
jgi:membrane-associated phospholipid phosphatase